LIFGSVVNKDLGLKAKAKDLTFKAKAGLDIRTRSRTALDYGVPENKTKKK